METPRKKKVTIKVLDKTDFSILIDGQEKKKIIGNKITDKGIFDSLDYTPYTTYTLDSKDEDTSDNAAFTELYNLYTDIITKINKLNSTEENKSL